MNKKIMALALAFVLAFSLAACSFGAASDPAASSEAAGTAATPDIADATGLLTDIWDAHTDDEKFDITGGDYDNMVDGTPGKVNAEDGDAMNNLFGFPAEQADKIDDAASIMHMMNANTFTAAAYHVKNAADVSTVAEALRDNIQSRQWICGFPDKLVILTVEDYVISAYGAEDLCDQFKSHAVSVYPSAETLYDEPIQ